MALRKLKDMVYRILERTEYDTEIIFKYRFYPKYARKLNENISAYRKALQEINAEEKNDKIRIVFICQVPANWDGMDSIYRAAKESEEAEAYIVAIPEKIIGKNYELTQEEYGENRSYEFCRQFEPDTINGYDAETRTFYDLKQLKPDYVFVQRPYDIHMPEEYRSDTLRTYTRLCFMPYGYSICRWGTKGVYNMEFLTSAFAVFADNTHHAEMITNAFRAFGCLDVKRVYDLGYPGFDAFLSHINHEPHTGRTVLWLPRWTMDEAIEASTFFKYKDCLIDYFKDKDVDFICRPHPLMFRNFISRDLMSEEELQEFRDIFNENEHFLIDEQGDFMDTLSKADLIISDFSGLLVPELFMDVPIIYTGETVHFESFTRKLIPGMYMVKNEDELIHNIDELMAGNDSLSEKRQEITGLILNGKHDVGKNVVKALVEDIRYGAGA